jgi:hypothetical protein
MNKIALYSFTTSLLAIGTYLHSPVAVISAVALWGLAVAETVLNQHNKDKEIVNLLSRMEKLEKEHKSLSMDITNVAERAKTVLGEVY